jgi:hypothetical protein
LLNPRRQPYDFCRVGADFLILGSFGKSVFKQIYSPALINRDWSRIAQVDYYDIYVAKKSAKKTLTLMKKNLTSQPKVSLIKSARATNTPGIAVETFYH